MYGICTAYVWSLKVNLCKYLRLAISLSVYPSIKSSLWYPSINLYPFIHLYKYSSPSTLHLSIKPSVYIHPTAIKPSICIYQSIPPSLHLSLPPSTILTLHLSLYPSLHHFNPPSLHPHRRPSVPERCPRPSYIRDLRPGCPIAQPGTLSPFWSGSISTHWWRAMTAPPPQDPINAERRVHRFDGHCLSNLCHHRILHHVRMITAC